MRYFILLAVMALMTGCGFADWINANPEDVQNAVDLAADVAGTAGGGLAKLIVGLVGTGAIGAAGYYGAKKGKK